MAASVAYIGEWLVALVIPVLLSSVPCGLSARVPMAVPVDNLCAVTLCPSGTVCRVVQACPEPHCLPKSACLPCVPAGSDQMCVKRGLAYAVLVGAFSEASNLRELTCDPRSTGENSTCHTGSFCTGSDEGRVGTCCYGKLQNTLTFVTSKEETPVCEINNGCGKCPAGYRCRRMEIRCPTPPCPFHQQCVDQKLTKPGSCPVLPAEAPAYCLRMMPKRFCDNDGQCPEKLKCCQTSCGGRKCMRAIFSS